MLHDYTVWKKNRFYQDKTYVHVLVVQKVKRLFLKGYYQILKDKRGK